jgi:hypothetical protein
MCCRQSGTEVHFLLVFQFPLPVVIPPTAAQLLIILPTLCSLDNDSIVKYSAYLYPWPLTSDTETWSLGAAKSSC